MKNIIINGKKTCKWCLKEKDKEYFAISSRHSDGRYPYCKECVNEKHRARHAKDPLIAYAKYKKWVINNKEKRSAHTKVCYAVKKGYLIRPNKCEICGIVTKKIDAHHWKGYKKEFIYDVQWLCRSCHNKQ